MLHAGYKKSQNIIFCKFCFLSIILFLFLGIHNANAKDKLKVVTTFTILADMVKNVAGDHAEVVSITKAGAEIHGYSPTPRDILKASDADLIIWNGLNLEAWFEQFFQNINETPSVTLSEGVDLISITEGNYEGKPNPHAWMGLDSALIYVDNIAKALIRYDPENAQYYYENAENYKDEIKAVLLPLKQKAMKIDEGKKWLVSCEGAFSYLARDFGLKTISLWAMNSDQTGTPQQIRKVIDAVKQHNIPAVFCESTINPAPAKQIARETGAVFGGLLYVDSLSTKDGPVPTYIDLLTVTSERIVNGLNGEIE